MPSPSLRDNIQAEIDHLSEYQQFVESQLFQARHDDFERVRQWLSETDGYDDQTDADVEYYEEHYKYFSPYEITFPWCTRCSFVVLAYFILEAQLKKIVRSIHPSKKPGRYIDRFQGDDFIHKCRNLFKEYADCKSINDDLWERVDDLRIVRNIIVHESGVITTKNDLDKLRDIATRIDGLLFEEDLDPDEESYLAIEAAYCAAIVMDICNLLDAILDVVERNIPPSP
jgi:hypothetical protein